MNYISLFSGIEAASVAWDSLGWNPVAFSEIEPFCCDLLSKRFPDVPNLGDVSGIDWTEYEGSIDVIIGGSPCQAFSLAGRRRGLMDERGLLMLEFVRCVREVKPRWVIWENVPGVLSQDGGRAFGTLLGELEDCGYALSWRVLDAQFFGVPQRRRRVFLIGHPMPGCAAGVLFDPDSLRGDNPPSREKRAQLAADAQGRAGSGYKVLPFDTTQVTSPQNGSNPQWGDPCHPLCAQGHTPSVCLGFSAGQSAKAGSIAIAFSWNQSTGFAAVNECAPTLRAAHSGEPAVCMASGQSNAEIMEECCPTQMARQYKDPPIVCEAVDARNIRLAGNVSGTLQAKESGGFSLNYQNPVLLKSGGGHTVRRLMPVECERLQGFPDGWTDLGGTADAPRYKACGNSMAVPVINYIGRRIEAVDTVF